MQKLYWLICGINLTFLQNYYIWQLLTICHREHCGRVLETEVPRVRASVASLARQINPSLLLVQPRKACVDLTKIVDWDVKNQIKQNKTIGHDYAVPVDKHDSD